MPGSRLLAFVGKAEFCHLRVLKKIFKKILHGKVTKMLWSVPFFSSSQKHTQKFQLVEWNKNRGIKKVQGARHISGLLIILLLVYAILLPFTSSSRSHQGNSVMERTRNPTSIINLRVSTGPALREGERAGEWEPVSAHPNLLCHIASVALHTMGLAGCSGAGGHRARLCGGGFLVTGLGTRKLTWPNHGEGLLMGEGCGDSQVH